MKWSFDQNKEKETLLGELYHQNSTHAPMLQMITAPRRRYTITSSDSQQYENELLSTDLMTEKESAHTLSYALKNRKTSWAFSPEDMTLNDLRHLFTYSFGLRDKQEQSRTYPAGGKFYPLEIYFVPTKRTIENGLLEAAVYKYNVDSDKIVKIKNTELSNIDQLTAATDVGFFSFDQAQILIFLVNNSKEMEVKYMSLAYRLVLLEAGHMAQNFLLMATDMGISSVPIGGFHEKRVNELLELEEGKQTMYLLLGG